MTDPLARTTDPLPSHDAARHDSFGPSAAMVLEALVMMEKDRGATREDIYRWALKLDRASISRRLTSLRRRGFVEATGERRDGGHGVKVTVWRSTADGRAWLRG